MASGVDAIYSLGADKERKAQQNFNKQLSLDKKVSISTFLTGQKS